MTTYVPPKKNTELVFYLGLVSQSTGQFQANPTLAAGDVKVATDDAAPANITTLPAVDADFTKRVKVTVSAAEMNGDNITVVFSDAAGAEWDDVIINIQTSTLQINDLATPAQVNTEVDTAIADARLDELLAADSDIDGAAPPVVGSVFHELMSKSTGSFTFDQTTDSNEALRDNLATATALQAVDDLVDDLESRLGTPSDLGGGATIAANLVDVESQTDDIGVAGAGLTALGDARLANLDAAISTRSSHSAADIWAVGTRTLTSFGTLVADIWSNATRTLTAISDSAGVTTLLSRIAGALNISGGKVESNVKQINDTNITGDGSGTPWGPA